MAELIFKKNGTCDLKFHETVKSFKRIKTFNYKNNYFKVYIDKNDSIYDVTRCEVVTWKSVEKGKSKYNVPDQISEKRDINLFNKIKGNPSKIAKNRIISEIDAQELILD